MGEALRRSAASELVSNHKFGFCSGGLGGCFGIDAAFGYPEPLRHPVSGGAVYLHLGAVCDRAGGTGYRQLLVGIWAECDPGADPDRRLGCYHRGGGAGFAGRAQDLLKAAQHHAGSSGCAAGGRHRAAYWLYCGRRCCLRRRCRGADALVFCPGIVGCGAFGWGCPLLSAFCNAGFDPAGYRASPLCIPDRHTLQIRWCRW